MRPKYNDHHFRTMLTLQQKELLTEYERCTKRIVTLDYQRLAALAALANRDVTRDDIFTIVGYVRRRMRKGDNKKKVGTFTPASLEFGNLLGDAARFEDRLQTAREELISKARRGKGQKPMVLKLEGGDTITRLADSEPGAPVPIKEALGNYLRGLIADLAK